MDARTPPTFCDRCQVHIGLSVSPDGETVLSSGARTTSNDDLWLIRNFR